MLSSQRALRELPALRDLIDDSRSFDDEITHRRLSRIKARVDAGDLFRSNHPIKPAL
jgi:hypothetical protein